jgi:hypothetical protein
MELIFKHSKSTGIDNFIFFMDKACHNKDTHKISWIYHAPIISYEINNVRFNKSFSRKRQIHFSCFDNRFSIGPQTSPARSHEGPWPIWPKAALDRGAPRRSPVVARRRRAVRQWGLHRRAQDATSHRSRPSSRLLGLWDELDTGHGGHDRVAVVCGAWQGDSG